MLVESEGLQWEVTPGDHDEMGPYHEPEITGRVLGLLPDGGVFLDVGAHVGHYALRAARKASMVIAVEPNPSTYQRLTENVALNELGNVRCLQIAAWDGVARLSLIRVHEPYVRDGSNYAVGNPEGEIWGARLDDALNQYPLRPDRLDLVKIDTEGADIRVLSGMAGLLARHRPVLWVEDHSCYGYYPREQLLAAISEAGYAAEQVTVGPADYWLCRPDPRAAEPSAPAARF